MKIAIGSDHAGYELKEQVIKYLINNGYEVENVGTNSKDSVDYPDFAKKVGNLVSKNECHFGILICYTGIGMSIACNKIRGIRAALVGKLENAVLTREHNNANVLCMASKDTPYEEAIQIVNAFLNTEFTFGRHENRVNKIMEIENEQR